MYGDRDYFHPDRFREAIREEWPAFSLKDSADEEFIQRFGQALLNFNYRWTWQEKEDQRIRLDELIDVRLPLAFFSTADSTERVAILAHSALIPDHTLAVIHNKVIDDPSKEYKKVMRTAVWVIGADGIGYHTNILPPDSAGGWSHPHTAPLVEVRGHALAVIADTTILDRDHAEFIVNHDVGRDGATEGAVDALMDLRDALEFCNENTHVPWVTHYA